MNQLKNDYQTQIKVLQEQLDTVNKCYKEHSEKYDRMSLGYQEQISKFEEVEQNNELEITKQKEEIGMYRTTRVNQTNSFQQMQKDVLRYEA